MNINRSYKIISEELKRESEFVSFSVSRLFFIKPLKLLLLKNNLIV